MTPSGQRLRNRYIALGITGSIAAYKAVELVRMFQKEGAEVRVLMTNSALEFVGRLTLETLSHHPVDFDVLSLQGDGQIGHIATAHDVEAIVVAPATAHWLGCMANGIAGDTITAACLATSVPVVVAPAMDGGMYAHAATQANLERLRGFGYTIVEPETGPLASGLVGQGRLADLGRIVDATVAVLKGTPARAGSGGGLGQSSDSERADAGPGARSPTRNDMVGLHVVVTAGGTTEPIDPVRYVGNRSTGKMGMAVAQDALDRGAAVTLILGTVAVEPPPRAHVAHAETAAQMQAALRALTPPEGPRFDVLIMAAAVADFRPTSVSPKKMVRTDGLTIEMEGTPDLLAETAERVREGVRASKGRRPILVGFAAETGSYDRVAEKLRAKGVDMLVANDVSEPGSGFGTDTNKVTIYSADESPEELPMMSKLGVAELLLDRVVVRLAVANASPAGARANGSHGGSDGGRVDGAARNGAVAPDDGPGSGPAAKPESVEMRQ
jgi:phosphopantothenoylcysteine decarboxylase / phosphopantothenate---cysteine ligase